MSLPSYTLTETSIEIMDETINRTKFEEWLVDWHPHHFSDGGEDEMRMYWQEKLGRYPAQDLLEYIGLYATNTEWDKIQDAISTITKG